MPHALVVEDDAASRDSLVELAARDGFRAVGVDSLAAARKHFLERAPDLVLLDLKLPDGNGLELFDEITSLPTCPDVVLITGFASVESAVEAVRRGARDYFVKPIDIERLHTLLVAVVEARELREEVESLRGELRKLGRFGRFVGTSPAMQEVFDLLARVAPTTATVLVTGESGTGKELVAQTVHDLSLRRKGPFLALNCGAVSPNLVESELFGHERGSFTGAASTHRGYFERANGGTLFLDEITEMPAELQVKLLRVIETSTFTRIGGDRPLETDARVIAATNRAPEEAVESGKLREDLFYRLQVFPIDLPPLRERPGDVKELTSYFLGCLNSESSSEKVVTGDALAALCGYSWPGNVRELKNVVQRAYILADIAIDLDCLPESVRGVAAVFPEATAGKARSGIYLPRAASIAEAERALIMAALEDEDGDKEQAARRLGISVRTLYNRLSDYESEAS